MEHKKSDGEFEARIDEEGKIRVPGDLAERYSGKRIHVRLSHGEIVEALKEKGVTESEVEEIARAQRESRDQVVKFLMTEGALTRSRPFRRDAKERRE